MRKGSLGLGWMAVGVPLLGTMVAVGQSGSGGGGGGGERPRPVLQALDTDRDGALSAAEIQTAPHSLLLLDRNGDGMLTVDELQPRPENAGASAEELTRQLMQFDRNGDGVLTPDELPARMQNLFQRGDANHDGRLTAEEIRTLAARQSMPAGAASGNRAAGAMRMDPLLYALDSDHDGVISAAEIAGASKSLLTLDSNGDGLIAANEMRPRQASPEERVHHLMDEWDTDKDGRLSKAEAPDRLQQQFAAIDTNGDGFLEKAELLVWFTAQNGPPNAGVAPGNGQQGPTQGPQNKEGQPR